MSEFSPQDEQRLGVCVLVVWRLPVRVKLYRNDKHVLGTVWTLMAIHDHHDRIHGFSVNNRGGFEAARGFAIALANDMRALSNWPDDEGFERLVLAAVARPEGPN